MLITFSGSTGAGKTTCAKFVTYQLRKRKFLAVYLAFRKLTLKHLFRLPIHDFQFSWPLQTAQKNGQILYTHKSFMKSNIKFIFYFPYYFGYMLFVYLLLLRWRRIIFVFDRYFYDSFFHFNLRSPFIQRGIKFFTSLMPRPFAAFLLSHPLEELKKYRSQFEPKYLEMVLQNLQYFHKYIHQGYLIQEGNIRRKAHLVWDILQKKMQFRNKREVKP